MPLTFPGCFGFAPLIAIIQSKTCGASLSKTDRKGVWRKLKRQRSRSLKPCGPRENSPPRVPVTTKSMAKKLRYMSNFAALFSRTDNTQLSCTQPITNLRTARLQIFPVQLLAFLHNANSYRTRPLAYFAIDSYIKTELKLVTFA